jgi:hypothetical protein
MTRSPPLQLIVAVTLMLCLLLFLARLRFGYNNVWNLKKSAPHPIQFYIHPNARNFDLSVYNLPTSLPPNFSGTSDHD